MKKKALMSVITMIVTASLVGCTNSANSTNSTNSTNSNENNKETAKIDVIATTFASYDLAKQVVGDNGNVEMLLNPGANSHSYEPTPSDIVRMQNADLVIYTGGEMEGWMDKVAETLDNEDTKLLRLLDVVNTVEEEHVDGMEQEEEHVGGEDKQEEIDEHIWTSVRNAIKITSAIRNSVSEMDVENAEEYADNAVKEITELKNLDAEFQEVVSDKVRDRLVFGDKFPFRYFVDDYGLQYSAAFSGCSSETEPSPKTIAFLVSKVKEEKIPVVLYIEMGNEKVATAIAKEAGAKAMQIHSLHNITKEDFENEETYISLMRRNVEVLKTALL